jgi:hypothetical protein
VDRNSNNNSSSGSSHQQRVAVDVSFKISDGAFTRDGILMQPAAVVTPLVKFALLEVKRRATNANTTAAAASNSQQQGAADLHRTFQLY